MPRSRASSRASTSSTSFLPPPSHFFQLIFNGCAPYRNRPAAAHILATLCILVAGAVFVLHLMHFRQRRGIYLAHPPGSIGSAVALTSHSGFGQLLLPYNNTAESSRALASLRFCLDGRTGAIVVDDSAIGFAGEAAVRMPTPGPIKDETMMTLMEKGDGVGPESPRVV